MRLQGFIPQDKSVLEILEFCERMEVVENLPLTSTMVPTKSNKKDKKRSRKQDSDNDNKSEATKDSTKA